jgi:hypothetical protein
MFSMNLADLDQMKKGFTQRRKDDFAPYVLSYLAPLREIKAE